MRKVFLLAILLTLTVAMSACSKSDKLSDIGLDGMSGKEILTKVADGSLPVDRFGLSVYDDELIVIIDDTRISVDMPQDEFYLSVAPYLESTHTCTFHSATGCRGEMKQEDFFLEFIDESGNVIISENMTSMSNGFIDLWLPKDIEGTLTISQGDLVVSKLISTASGEPTCETTMQLN